MKRLSVPEATAVPMALVDRNGQSMLTAAEAAGYLGIKVQTLSTWRCTRRYHLPFVRVGRAIRYRLSDLEKFISARTVGGLHPVADQLG
jgi:excisionase family DNA binding protein